MQVSLDNRVKQQNYFSNRSNVSFRGDIDDIIVVDESFDGANTCAKNVTTISPIEKTAVETPTAKTDVSPAEAKKAVTILLPEKATDVKTPVKVQDTRNLNYFGKNPNQILSVAPEHKNLGLGCYDKGGLAVVAKEAPMSWVKDLKADVRSMLPYHSTSKKGNMMIVRLPLVEAKKFETLDELPSYVQKEWMHEVPVDYKPSKNEFFAVINNADKKDSNGKSLGYPYIKLDKTGIKGEIEALDEGYFQTQKIKYHLFKASKTNAEQRYFMHIPQLAAIEQAYKSDAAYVAGQVAGQWPDLYYSNFCRAVSDAMPQMAEKEGFNPASLWMHDRPMFPLQADIARRSCNGEAFYQGFKMHSTLHNPGFGYQGYLEDIEGIFKIAFHSDDYKLLSARPDFEIIKDILSKPKETRTIADNKRLLTVFGDYCEMLCDEYKRPNITMITIANRLLNPDNATVGSVSKNYGDEMKRLRLIAKGLTSKLASIDTLDVTNGSIPASLGIDKRKDFGKGGNGLTANNSGYTPYNPIIGNDKVVNYSNEDVIKNKQIIDNKIKEEEAKLTQKIAERKKMYKDAKEINAQRRAAKKANKEDLVNELTKKILILRKKRINNKNNEIPALEKALAQYIENTKISIKDAKLANKKWVLDLISKCKDEKTGEIDNKAILKLFYNDAQIEKNKLLVHGYLSKYEEGDKLFTNWGRSDEQKGFSTFLQGFYEYIKSDAPKGLTPEQAKKFQENKKHVKLLFGSAGLWPKESTDYKAILKYMDLIKKEGYGNNVLYVEGFFPNNLVGACDFGLFTSRFEPCGITPLETYSAGCPVASIRTGGAPNFVFDKKDGFEKATGFLTDKPFFIEGEDLKKATIGHPNFPDGYDSVARKKEIFGDLVEVGLLDKRNMTIEELKKIKEVPPELVKQFEDELDEMQRYASSKEVSTLFSRCMGLSESEYDELAKNACEQKIEWKNNGNFNLDASGKNPRSANVIYFEDAFGISSNNLAEGGERTFIRERSMKPMKKLTGEFGDTSKLALETVEDTVETSIANTAKRTGDIASKGSNFLKRLIHDRRAYYAAASIAAVAGIAAYAINRNNSEEAMNKPIKIGSSKVYF